VDGIDNSYFSSHNLNFQSYLPILSEISGEEHLEFGDNVPDSFSHDAPEGDTKVSNG
jgi:hypothetical protein